MEELRHFSSLLEDELITAHKIFGIPSLKHNGQVFVSMDKNGAAFKMAAEHREEVCGIEGCGLYQPPVKNAPVMKEWVFVPFEHEAKYLDYAHLAIAYVKTLPAKSKKRKK